MIRDINLDVNPANQDITKMKYDEELQHTVELIGHTEKLPYLFLYDDLLKLEGYKITRKGL